MSWLESRLPTRRALIQVFLVCVLPVHAWTWVLFLNEVPSLLLQFSIVQILGIFAYAQSLALLESVLLCGLVVVLGFILPRRFFLDIFIPQGATLALVVTVWAIGMHIYQVEIADPETTLAEMGAFINCWTIGWLFGWVTLALAVYYWKWLQATLEAFADRLTVLSGFFILVDILSIIAVLIRNILGLFS